MFLRRLLRTAGLLLASLASQVLAASQPGQSWPAADIPPGLRVAAEVQGRAQGELLLREGVVGVGIGENAAGRPVLHVFLARGDVTGVPAVVEGIPVQRIVSGRFRSGEIAAQEEPLTTRDRWPRPVPIGVSIGHMDVTAGTLGCQVTYGTSCHTDYYVLSNNHVLANENLGVGFDYIVQPGVFDGGTVPADTLAYLGAREPIVFSTEASNIMDAALGITAAPDVGRATPPDGYGLPRSVPQSATPNLAVQKYGRTTRLTTGRITTLNATVHVDYKSGVAQFIQQLVVTGDNNAAFSQGGDSGSLVVVRGGPNDRRPVGLLFAGAGTISIVSPIAPILTRFGVDIAGE